MAQLLPGCLIGPKTIYVPSGKLQQISVNCTPQGAACYDLMGTAKKDKPSKDCSAEKAALDAAQTTVTTLVNTLNALNVYLKSLVSDFSANCGGSTNTPRCFVLAQQIAQTKADIANLQAELQAATKDLARARAAYEICLAQKNAQGGSALSQSPASVVAATSSATSTPPNQASASLQFCGVTSVDPNAKLGVSGAGQVHYVRDMVPMSYSILFENLPTAGAAASQVVVTDVLASALDLSTLSINSIRFGSTDIELPMGLSAYTTSVDLTSTLNLFVNISAQLVGNTLTITFTSIDPATGKPPNDLRGFLPPNTNPPAGEGSISFTITPKQGLATGRRLRTLRPSCSILTPP